MPRNKRQPAPPPATATPIQKRHGCLYYAGMGLLAFLAISVCGAIANIVNPRTPASPAPGRAAVLDVSQETSATPAPAEPSPAAAIIAATATNTQVAPTATQPQASATNTPALPTATQPQAIATNTPAPPTATQPQATATNTPAPPIIGAVVGENANLRSGPGTDYAVVGGAVAGDQIAPVGRNSAGDWLQLANGAWIAAALVLNPPGDLPVTAAAPVVATTAAAAPIEAQPNAFTCVGGCAIPPDPSCAIKGNVNSKKELIYHMPGWRDYNRTDIKPEEGDRWFCTAEEAQAAGFRAPQNP